MRLFIAIFLPEDVKKEIKNTQEKVRKLELMNARYAETDNLHLTLKFLGEVTTQKADEISKKLSKIKEESFETTISQAGIFTPSEPKILWLEMSGAEKLQKKIDETMEEEGFKKEPRFMSHITIARIKQMNKTYVMKLLDEMNKKEKEEKFKIKKFSLVESELTPSGPKYKVIKDYKLE
ncbi:MAG: RNA 2',3'-cyclic phosphodiesterase [Nanoarchaeota archaeon]